jgi:hypothetical protein
MELSQKLDRLEELANKIGYEVVPNSTNEFLPDAQIIKYNSRQKLINKIFALGHEIGHALTYPSCLQDLGEKAFSGPVNTWRSREAELRAWEEADKLMRIIGLYGPEYFQYKHRCIRTYYC